MTSIVRVIFCGVVKKENYSSFVSKINQLNSSKNGPFDFVLAVGEFEVSSTIEEPQIPIYFNRVFCSNSETLDLKSESINCVSGFFEVNGVKIQFEEDSNELSLTEENDEIDVLVSEAVDIDVVKNEYKWPRYHFCATTSPREGFVEQNTDFIGKVDETRFVFLQEFGGSGKSLHALKLDPSFWKKQETALPMPPPTAPRKKPKFDHEALVKQHNEQREKDLKERQFSSEPVQEQSYQKRRNYSRKNCWFCLNSPACKKHLVVVRGEEFYLASPMGQFNAHHIQIVPNNHLSSFKQINKSSLEELISLKRRILQFFLSMDCLGLITIRNLNLDLANQQHIFIDFIPIPLTLRDEEESGSMSKHLQGIESALANMKVHLKKLTEEPSDEGLEKFLELLNTSGSGEFYYFEVPGIYEASYFEKNEELLLQLGRAVASELLNVDRVDWRACVLNKHEEVELVNRFKSELAAAEKTE
eukprot:augustus_masked-scaffold_29-processed-gene-1.12-mRNA-1 protein AED:1.00 eAED:1.00 QI:0/-1/0/0/-1/1/1/0/472